MDARIFKCQIARAFHFSHELPVGSENDPTVQFICTISEKFKPKCSRRSKCSQIFEMHQKSFQLRSIRICKSKQHKRAIYHANTNISVQFAETHAELTQKRTRKITTEERNYAPSQSEMHPVRRIRRATSVTSFYM